MARDKGGGLTPIFPNKALEDTYWSKGLSELSDIKKGYIENSVKEIYSHKLKEQFERIGLVK